MYIILNSDPICSYPVIRRYPMTLEISCDELEVPTVALDIAAVSWQMSTMFKGKDGLMLTCSFFFFEIGICLECLHLSSLI